MGTPTLSPYDFSSPRPSQGSFHETVERPDGSESNARSLRTSEYAPTHRLVLIHDATTSQEFAVAAVQAVFGVTHAQAQAAVAHAQQHDRCALVEGSLIGLIPALDLLIKLSEHAHRPLTVVVDTIVTEDAH